MNKVRQIIGLDQLQREEKEFQSVTICILDSGIYPHVDLAHKVVAFKDFVHKKEGLYDDYGHGTHIAGICGGTGKLSKKQWEGVSAKSKFIIGKVLQENGEGKMEDLLRGIQWCLDNKNKYHIRILNISVGMMPHSRLEAERYLMDAIDDVWRKGIVIVCAAGNNGPRLGTITIPGTNKNVITVGSVEMRGKRLLQSDYSGRGENKEFYIKPEVYAPGSIISCSNTGWYVKKTGTSMAVPVVAGAIALLLERHPDLTPAQVKKEVIKNVKQMNSVSGNSGGVVYLPYLLS